MREHENSVLEAVNRQIMTNNDKSCGGTVNLKVHSLNTGDKMSHDTKCNNMDSVDYQNTLEFTVGCATQHRLMI